MNFQHPFLPCSGDSYNFFFPAEVCPLSGYGLREGRGRGGAGRGRAGQGGAGQGRAGQGRAGQAGSPRITKGPKS